MMKLPNENESKSTSGHLLPKVFKLDDTKTQKNIKGIVLWAQEPDMVMVYQVYGWLEK